MQFFSKENIKKFSAPFWPLLAKICKNSAANLFGRTYFLLAPFELCGQKFGQLATLQIGHLVSRSSSEALNFLVPTYVRVGPSFYIDSIKPEVRTTDGFFSSSYDW
jgi:hypothetical protein